MNIVEMVSIELSFGLLLKMKFIRRRAIHIMYYNIY